jgi:hypothetical protein
MSAATPLFSPTLASVRQAFDDWRATRGKRTRTPIGLQRRAAALVDAYPASHICRALKINDTALKRWRHETQPLPPLSPAPLAGLVELPIEPLGTEYVGNGAGAAGSISIELDDAMQLRVHGSFTLEQILHAARTHQQAASS